MARARANGVEIEYDIVGDGPETVLMIMGLGGQMTRWPPALTARIAAEGFRVVVYDNRDVGLSTGFDAAGPADIAAVITAMAEGRKPEVPYLLDDMAADAAGLLDALGVERAHLFGVSMGGMIGQMVAANHPEKTLSLVSVMSTTGARAVPPPTPEAQTALMARAPDGAGVEVAADYALKAQIAIQSPGYPLDPVETRARLRADIVRAYRPAGVGRQMAAVIASGDRRERLRTITAPTIVVHGVDDPLVRVEGGRDTAATIAGAELRLVPGMGHDLPAGLFDVFVKAVIDAAERARATA
ncbi:alpha/beta hydrolase [Caulobacter sp. CCUG 60055]|nr:alpha/beta hydrolase [Caulobacter sp. CCUG 60055]MBQ1541846.1 alpha/beta hydrolase [Caulobacteraceae bacterium]MCI3181299.1 alpha/beta hydrolase [Caulobacter sp. CCUG 60055]